MADASSRDLPTNLPSLPEIVTQEKIVESPASQVVLEQRHVGKFLKADTTPDVHDVEHWKCQNVVPVTITNFEHGQEGQHLYIKGDGQTTLKHGVSIFMSGGADLLLAALTVYHFVGYKSTPLKWYQVVDQTGGGGAGVTSFNGRVGVVVGIEADYTLDLLGDVTVAGPVNGQFIVRRAGMFVNDVILAADVPNLDTSKLTTGILPVARGGTGLGAYAKGDVIYASAVNTLSALPGPVVDGWLLTWNNATLLPEWRAPGAGGGTLTGGGTLGVLSKWTAATVLGDSIVSEAGKVISVTAGANAMAVALDSSAGFTRDIRYSTAGVSRWALRANNVAEGGADAGSNFVINRRSDAGADLGDVFEIIRSSGAVNFYYASGALSVGIIRGTVDIQPQDAALEGGEVILRGALNGAGPAFRTWNIDNWSGQLRIFNGANVHLAMIPGSSVFSHTGDVAVTAQGGTSARFRWIEDDQIADEKRWDILVEGKLMLFRNVNDAETVNAEYLRLQRGAGTVALVARWTCNVDWTVNNTYDLGSGGNYPRFISCATGFTLNGSAALDFAGAVLRLGNSATWTQMNFMVDNVARWHIITGGTFAAVVDNTHDIGATFTTLRPKNVYLAGYCGQPNFRKITAADQATFVNAQTNITGLSFAIGVNETWTADVVISATTAVAATGVKFYFTFPVGCTGEIHYGGNIATIATWQTLYQAVLTVPGTFFLTGTGITGQYTMRATFRNGGTGGTIQVVGISGGATTTIAVKKGSLLIAERTA